MTILELALAAYGVYDTVGTAASIISGIDFALRLSSKSTAEDIFKKSFVETVRQSAADLAELTETSDPKTVSVDNRTLDSVIASLQDINISTLALLEEDKKFAQITKLFQKCVILPGHQLTTEEFEQQIRPVVEKTIADFYRRLPFKQEAFSQIMLEIQQAQLKNQDRIIAHTQSIKDDTEVIKNDNEVKKTTRAALDEIREVKAQLNVNISDDIAAAVETEHQKEIDDARKLLKKGSPRSALSRLEDLKDRSWDNASANLKFKILTNMAAAQYALNKKLKAAKLLLRAFQYNPKNENALSNRALAYLLRGETDKAADDARKTLEKNPENINAYVVLVEISTGKETLEEAIAKVPKYLRETPEIACAISDIAKQRKNFEEAKKWRETMVAYGQEDAPNFKADLATILIDEVLDDSVAVFTKQLNETQKEQLKRAIELLTEAWNCVSNTELRTVRTDWIFARSIAYLHLGNTKEAIDDLNIALAIEPSDPILIKNHALLTFDPEKPESTIESLEKIQSTPEVPETPILLANSLRVCERFEEAIKTLNDFLVTNPPLKLKTDAERLLVNIYIAEKRFEEAQNISTSMQESSPTSISNLVDAARISSAIDKHDEARSLLKEAHKYAQDSEPSLDIVELADELYKHEQFKAAATLYAKLADTSQDSELTQWLVKSHYEAGEIGKALEICRELRAKYGVLKDISMIEYWIYEDIGDLNQALEVCEAYLKKFPNDTDMQIHLGYVHYRLNNDEAFKRLLEKSFDLDELSLQSCFNLANLYRVGSKPEKALHIMYAVRRKYYDNEDVHRNYIGLFYQVEKHLNELLNPTQVQSGTAVCLDKSGKTDWYIIVEREDADIARQELPIQHPLAQQLLGKNVDAVVQFEQTSFDPKNGKIVAIKSKYVYALQDSWEFSDRFPETQGFGSIKLDDSSGDSDDSTDIKDLQPIFDFADKRHEASLRIEEAYKENPLPIGTFTNLTGGTVLDTWGLLISKSDLGIRCCTGNSEEKNQALTLLGNPKPKLAVDIISLLTLHCLEAADIIIEAFGKLAMAQSTIDELQQTIYEREGMWSEREGMTIEKEGGRYVRDMIEPEEIRRGIEYLKGILKWVSENCEVLPCTAALQMNQLRKRKLDEMFQPCFMDTLLIASETGYLLLSDDERLRSYAKTNLNKDAGIVFQINGVWTQVVLEHCVKTNLLEKSDYDKMTIKLICSHYYHTEFNSEVLIEAAKQSDWKPTEPYNSLVQALGYQEANFLSTLDEIVEFLFKLWLESIQFTRREHLTLSLLDGLTSGQRTRVILKQLASRVYNKYTLHPFAKPEILSLIQAYAQTHLS